MKPNIPSKIVIVKTFILSQLTYLASILPASNSIITKIENIICNFININTIPFKKKLIFSSTESGGLGIPDIKTYLQSIYLKTIFRANLKTEQWMKYLSSFFPLNSFRFISNSTPEIPLFKPMTSNLDKFNFDFFCNDSKIW